MIFPIGETVRIVKNRYHPRWVGLEGKVVWADDGLYLYQVATFRKPPYYRPAHPPWIVTVKPEEIERVK